MLEVWRQHNYSNDMFRWVTDDDSKLYAGTAFLKIKKKRTLNGHFSRPAETDPYVKLVQGVGSMWGTQL